MVACWDVIDPPLSQLRFARHLRRIEEKARVISVVQHKKPSSLAPMSQTVREELQEVRLRTLPAVDH